MPSSVPAAGGRYPLTLTATDASCTWNARTDAPWASVTPNAGQGNATTFLAVAENTSINNSRTLTVTVNTQSLRVVQDAHPCVLTLSPTALTAPNGGGQLQVRVAADTACRWTVSANQSWVTVRTTSGSGTDYAYFNVAANSGEARQAIVTIGGIAVTVTQPRG